jgi:hypothetical protein
MTTADDLNMLGRTVEAARETKKTRLAQVEAETQAAIDKYQQRMMEATEEGVKRYHRFKLGLWEAGDRVVSDPLWNITRVNPDTLEFSEIYEPERKIIFQDTSHDSGFYFAVPLEYFNDPEQWEKNLLKWLDDVNAMVKNAPDALGQDFVYRASTIGLPYPGDYFRLHQKSLGEKPVMYIVEYHTGNIFGAGIQDIENSLTEPLGCLG